MAKMKAAMATVREKMSNIYKADMLETCKAQDAAKGQRDPTKKKVVFNYDRNIVHLMHDGDAIGKVSTKVIAKKKDTDTDGFVAVTKGKGSPSKKGGAPTATLKRTTENSFTALQGKDDADDDDEGCFHDTVEFSKASPPSKSKRNLRRKSFNATTRQNDMADEDTKEKAIESTTTKDNLTTLSPLNKKNVRAEEQMEATDATNKEYSYDTKQQNNDRMEDEEKDEQNSKETEDKNEINKEDGGKEEGNETGDKDKDEQDNRGDDDSSMQEETMETEPPIIKGHFGIRVETFVADKMVDMGSVRNLLKLLSQAQCTFYNFQEMGGATRGSNNGVDWDNLKDLNDDELIKYLNLSMIQWGSHKSIKNLRLCFSFWVDCVGSKTLLQLKQNATEIVPFLKTQDWYIKNHTLHQSQTVNVAFIMGKHPLKTYKEGLQETISEFFNEKSSRQGSIYIDVIHSKVNVNDSKVPVLAVQCGLDDRKTIDNILKSGARHPTIDILSEKLKHANRTEFTKAMENHMTVCQCSTAITIIGLKSTTEDSFKTALLKKLTEKKECLIVDLERHRHYNTIGKYYAICHKNDIEEAILWTNQCLATVGDEFWSEPGTAPLIVAKPVQEPRQKKERDTEWDNYSYSSRTFASRETDASGASTWADKVRGMESKSRIPFLIIPTSSDASSVGESSKGSLTTSLFTNQEKASVEEDSKSKNEDATRETVESLASLVATMKLQNEITMKIQAELIESLTAQVKALTDQRKEPMPSYQGNVTSATPKAGNQSQQEAGSYLPPYPPMPYGADHYRFSSGQMNMANYMQYPGPAYGNNPNFNQGFVHANSQGQINGYYNASYPWSPPAMYQHQQHDHQREESRTSSYEKHGMTGMPPSAMYTPQRNHKDQHHQDNETLQEETGDTNRDEHYASSAAGSSEIFFSAQSNNANNKKRMTPATPLNNGANMEANRNTFGENHQESISTDNQQSNSRRTVTGNLPVRNQGMDHQHLQGQNELPVISDPSPEVTSNDLGKRAKLSQSPKSNSNMETTPLKNNTTKAGTDEISDTPLGTRKLFAESQNETTKAPPYDSPPPGGGNTAHRRPTESSGERLN
jgi:hypothetical protein